MVALLWGTTPPPGRGPKPSLSVDQVVRAAIVLADAEGLDAVTMRRVADEVGVTTMALYRYVHGKRELLLLMDDRLSVPPDPDPTLPWRQQVERWARAALEMYRRHPWAIRIPLLGPPLGPGQTSWFERGLQAMAGSGLAHSDRAAAIMLLSYWVWGEARLNADLAEAVAVTGVAPDDWGRWYVAALGEAVDAERFPEVSALLASGYFDGPAEDGDPDSEVDFALDLILDGIEGRARARRRWAR